MPLNTRLKTILKEYLIWVKWLQKKKKKKSNKERRHCPFLFQNQIKNILMEKRDLGNHWKNPLRQLLAFNLSSRARYF